MDDRENIARALRAEGWFEITASIDDAVLAYRRAEKLTRLEALNVLAAKGAALPPEPKPVPVPAAKPAPAPKAKKGGKK